MRSLGMIGVVVGLAACSFDPPGLCRTSSECPLGAYCASEGLCVEGCDSDARCDRWEECALSVHDCGLRVGMCNTNADCLGEQTCDTNAHRCSSQGRPCVSHDECVTQEVCSSGVCAYALDACTSRVDCRPFEDCVHGGCYSGVDALFTGFFNRDSFWGGIATVQIPERYRLPFGIETPFEAMVMPTTGEIAYVGRPTSGPNTIMRVVEENLIWSSADGRWTWPKSPEKNDQVLAVAAGCTRVVSVLIRQGLSEVAYTCADGRTYNSKGIEIAPFLARAWNRAGHLLGEGTTPSSFLYAPAPGSTPAEFSIAGRTLYRARAHRDSFRLLMGTTTNPVAFELWAVTASATPTKLGNYPAIPDRMGTTGLAADGSMLYIASTRVRRAALEASSIETVHDNANAPAGANDETRRPFIGYLFVYPESSHVITPP